MKLLRELNENVEYLKEDSKTGKNYYIKGIFLQADLKNKNGRIYPSKVLESAVNKYNSDFIGKKRSFAELGHPESVTINLDKVSHIITELNRDGNNFIGKAKIIDTPMGKIVKSFIDEGCLLGVSSRGLGSIEEQHDGTKVVNSDFFINAIDIVHDASAPEAFVENLLENKEWVFELGHWVPKYLDRNVKPLLRNKGLQSNEKIALKLLKDFVNKI